MRFTLKDTSGKLHNYIVGPHPAIEGQRVMWALLAAGVEPIGAAVGEVLSGETLAAASKALDGIDSVADLKTRGAGDLLAIAGDVLDKVDFGSLGASAARAFAAVDAAGLTLEVLKHTTRDGFPLSSEGHFNAAFSANYGELIRAVFGAVRVNRFFPLPDTSGIEGLVDRATATLGGSGPSSSAPPAPA